jgi:hypothetical protein
MSSINQLETSNVARDAQRVVADRAFHRGELVVAFLDVVVLKIEK